MKPAAREKEATRFSIQRLGRNINGYLGQRIDIATELRDCLAAAQSHGWSVENISVPGKEALLTFARRSLDGEPDLTAHRKPFNIYISAGIHGDEPAGPLAVRRLLQENVWPAGARYWICPCLNPSGFALNRRENSEGLDLNRQYLQPLAAETKAHMEWLTRQPEFDLCLCLHEDWESYGFYVYELNPDNRPSLAASILEHAAEVCPIDNSDLIEGRPAKNGLIRPSVDPRSRPQWPESFFLLTCKTRLAYTLEAPSDFPLPNRVAALVQGTRAAIQTLVN